MGIKFKIYASTHIVGSTVSKIIDIDPEDLEGVPEEEWETYVWDELGGMEAAIDLADLSIERVK